MLQRMSSRELTEWVAYAQVEPFGQETQYLGHAITASTVANANRRKGSKASKPADFMPKFGKQEQSVEQMIQLAEMMTVSMGGQDMRQEQSEDG